MITKAVRFDVFKRDRFTCQYCGRSGVELEIDHIVPLARGGTDDVKNLITACKDCNRGKGAVRLGEERKETKSRRVQLLIRPTIYDSFKRIAEAKGKSVNDYLNELIEAEVVR